MKFPDLIHTQKRHPESNVHSMDAYWDFLSHSPESLHQIVLLFSDRGIPDGYCHMHGYSANTFKFVNGKEEHRFVKFHLKTDQKIKNLSDNDAKNLAGSHPDYATKDLFSRIEKGEYPSWTVYVQIMEPEQAAKNKWNVCDVTKVWPHSDFPLIRIGSIVLNRNSDNHFSEVEQAAFSPANLIPGMLVSDDKLLQGRLFACSDAARYRLGVNYSLIPINQPFTTRVRNKQRDGSMMVSSNGGSDPNYDSFEVATPGEDLEAEQESAEMYLQNIQSSAVGIIVC